MKPKYLFAVGILLLAIMACNLPALTTPTPSTNPSEPTATVIVPTDTPVITGSTVVLSNVTFTIPEGLAKDALTEMVSVVTDPNAPPWEIAPAHLEFTLTSYQLQDKFHKPKIFVYPAEEYALAQPSVATNIQRIKDITAGAQLSKDILPGVPAFNAAQLIATKIEVVKFQSGSGVRFLTEYAQYPATINNHDLFYLFEGLTGDGKYYIIAILPVTSPILAETDKPDAIVPAGGAPLPADSGPNDAYYVEVTDKLNAVAVEDFQPALSRLDALIQSIIVTP